MPSRGSEVGVLAAEVGGVVIGDPATTVIDATHDSRQVEPGWLYLAIRGAVDDGHRFVPAAIGAGASALVVDHPMGSAVTELVVDDTRAAMGDLASVVHGRPSHSLPVVGVTGTNGKTTVTHYVESITSGVGMSPGLIGTIETRVDGTALQSARTTPEATDFQRLLSRMRHLGADVVAAEVSSHALELGRVRGTRFAVAAFTNLSQDHLDFHGDMASYARAKERLFLEYEVGTAVVNVDDPAGRALAEKVRGPLIAVGRGADVEATDVHTGFDGSTFELRAWGQSMAVRSPVIGEFNVSNALVAAGCSLALGLELDGVASGLGDLSPVPGRFELVSGEGERRVVVDYAHTPDGIRKVLDVARRLTGGRVIALVGAGGDRDREKRPLMGEAASAADIAVITSDNPRSEDPSLIIEEVMSGVSAPSVIVEVERRRAINLAIESARPGDVVLVLGKGHEPGQEIGGVVHPFDDREVAREALAGSGDQT